MTKPRRRTIRAAMIGVAFAAMVAWWLCTLGRPFDPVAWRADATVGAGPRQAMTDRLIARRTLIGKTRAEVVQWLGEPPPTPYFSRWDLVYWLGDERGFLSIDSEWLVLRLGSDGRVADARLVTD